MKSSCCNADYKPTIGVEKPHFLMCLKCQKPCGLVDDLEAPAGANADQRTFPGGAVRDSNAGKPRYDLIPPEALLRVAKHYAYGAQRYAPDNWKKGMTREAFIESAFRHFEAMRMSKTDEDHAAACVWNVCAIMWLEEQEK